MTDRQRRWLTAVLVLGAIVLAMVAIELAATVFFAFGDVILVFFLAWLLAFILSPVVAGLTRLVPILPRIGAVVLVYATLVGAIVLVVVLVAGALAQSITAFIASVPTLRERPARPPRPVAGPAQRARPRPGRPRGPGDELPRQPRRRTPPSWPARSSSWRSPASARSATC